MAHALRIGDLIPDFAEFVRTSFDLQPAVYPEAMSHRADLMPTSAIIDGLLELEVLPAHQVRMTRERRGLPQNAFTRLVGEGPARESVDRARVIQLFRSGATLTINDLQTVWPPAREFVRTLSETFACRCEATIFATPAGKSGFAPHSDELGVLVVQVEGTKDWRVWPTDLSGPRTKATFEDDALGDPLFEVTMEPGDVLYLPHGTPHAAAATHDQSVHISLCLRPRGWHEIVSAVVQQVVDDQARASFPALAEENFPAVSAELAGQLEQVRTRLADLDVEDALRTLRHELLAELVPAQGGLADLHRLDRCSLDQLFRVTTDSIELVDEADERSTVRIDGVTVTLPKAIVGVLTEKTGVDRSLTCRQIYPEVPAGRAMTMAKQLARLGALTAVPEGV